jgi:hypothetical protein
MMTKVKERGMTSAEVISALESCDAIHIGVRLIADGGVVHMKWRERSDAMRRRIRALIGDEAKKNATARFNATVHDIPGERILMLGDVKE